MQVRDRRGRLLRELGGAHSGAVMAPVIGGPDGEVLWSAGRDGLLSAWSLGVRGGLLTSLVLGTSPFSGQASRTRAAALDYVETDLNRAFLLDPKTGVVSDPLPMPEGCNCQPWAVAVAGDGSVAVGAVNELGPNGLARDRGHLAVWDPASSTPMRTVLLPWDPVGVGVTPDGSRAVVNGSRGIAVVDLALGEVVAQPHERASVSCPRRRPHRPRRADRRRAAQRGGPAGGRGDPGGPRHTGPGSRSATAAAGHRPRMGGR